MRVGTGAGVRVVRFCWRMGKLRFEGIALYNEVRLKIVPLRPMPNGLARAFGPKLPDAVCY